MCLAFPGKIVELDGNRAVVDFGGVRQEVDVSLLEDVKVGDWVLVHTGFAIQKMTEEEAKASLEVWEEVLKHMEEELDELEGP
ncbi:MAG: HypC/HybG/HupF family hydrogenase formation chaperone [Methanopyri archaeon]|nr:HypC/HybG/HupF family hydrogenase formation chaperone [Methanopyri archaeon]